MTLQQLEESMSAEEFGLWLMDDALWRQPAAAPVLRAWGLGPEEFFEAIERGR